MSETVTPVAPPTEPPATAAGSGPLVGNSSEAAPAAPVVEAPPAPSPAAETPVAEATTPKAGSLLGDAGKEAPAAEAVAPEQPAADAKPLPTYEPFKLPDGVQFDDERVGEFNGVLGEFENRIAGDPAQAHTIMQEMGQRMVDLYVREITELRERSARLQHEHWERTRQDWASQFREDADLGRNQQQTTLARCGAMLDRYGSVMGKEREQAVRDVLTMTGAGDHPEIIRLLHWASTFAVEQPRPVAAPVPIKPIPMTRSARLYRNSLGGAA